MEKQKKPKVKKDPKPKKEKAVVTESEHIQKYVGRIIRNAQYHGRVDEQKFQGMVYEKTVSKNLWMDKDFFCSLVFQSSNQKYKFLEELAQRFNLDIGEEGDIKIINGLTLAKALNIELELETTKPYPTGNIDLMPFVLDNETIN